MNLITPDEIDTRLGKLTFTDGAPSRDAIQKILDKYDVVWALRVDMDAHQGASIAAFFKGFREVGAEDGDIIIFSELMDSQTLFLTPNADTVYCVGVINLQDGPMVFESPPDALGVIDDCPGRIFSSAETFTGFSSCHLSGNNPKGLLTLSG